jgi:addiction module HigA family antidote
MGPMTSKSLTTTRVQPRLRRPAPGEGFTREEVDAGLIDFSDIDTGEWLPPLHPGEMLLEEFLKPLDMTPWALAKALHVPVNRVTAIVAGRRAVTADTAMRLARYFGGSPDWWLRLQTAHDLDVAKREGFAERIAAEVQPRAA